MHELQVSFITLVHKMEIDGMTRGRSKAIVLSSNLQKNLENVVNGTRFALRALHFGVANGQWAI